MWHPAASIVTSEPFKSRAFERIGIAATAFAAGPDPQAWADLAHALFNVKEFVFVK